MREIKFRAWDGKKMWDDPIQETDGPEFTTLNDNIQTGFRLASYTHLMQYTGLKDKNGVEIYHKDYVQMGPWRYIVEWDDKAAKFYLAAENELDTQKYTMTHATKSGEVVGNIYEN